MVTAAQALSTGELATGYHAEGGFDELTDAVAAHGAAQCPGARNGHRSRYLCRPGEHLAALARRPRAADRGTRRMAPAGARAAAKGEAVCQAARRPLRPAAPLGIRRNPPPARVHRPVVP